MRAFGSDNYAGVHAEVLRAMEEANRDHARSYGADPLTRKAEERFREIFGPQARVYFVSNGTAANTLALSAMVRPQEAIVCASTAHINIDECGAPERFTGAKLLPVDGRDGKLTPDDVATRLTSRGDIHRNRPAVVSISQATEYGTVYTLDELRALASYVHREGLFLHVDGARLANAAAHLGCSLRAMTTEAGADVIAFGGTKNGLMFGEAVVFLNPDLGHDFARVRKQGMQLLSKMRFISAQFLAILENDLWLRSARHANAMARQLSDRLARIPGVRITRPTETNAVFAEMPRDRIAAIQEKVYFYLWDAPRNEVRIMLSFESTEDDVEGFVRAVESSLG